MSSISDEQKQDTTQDFDLLEDEELIRRLRKKSEPHKAAIARVAATRLKKYGAEIDDLAYRFSCLLDHATGGMLSKTNYDKQTMYTHVDDHVNKMVEQAREDDADEVAKEALADVKTHRANWREAIERTLEACPTPTDESDDAQYWKHELAVFDQTFDALIAAIASMQMEVGRRFTVEEMNKIVERKVAERVRALT